MGLRQLVLASGMTMAIAGCVSQVVQTTEYSGYLGDYSQLQETKSPTGEPTKRWLKPGTDLSQYRAVYIKPTVFYPAPEPNEKVTGNTLSVIAARCDSALAREVVKAKPLASKPGPGVLVIAPAITAVNSNKEGLKPYEVIPIALIVAGVSTATGTRDEDSNLYVEAMISDGATGSPVAKSVRKIRGDTLENSRTKIGTTTFNKGIDQAAIDVRLLLSQKP